MPDPSTSPLQCSFVYIYIYHSTRVSFLPFFFSFFLPTIHPSFEFEGEMAGPTPQFPYIHDIVEAMKKVNLDHLPEEEETSSSDSCNNRSSASLDSSSTGTTWTTASNKRTTKRQSHSRGLESTMDAVKQYPSSPSCMDWSSSVYSTSDEAEDDDDFQIAQCVVVTRPSTRPRLVVLNGTSHSTSRVTRLVANDGDTVMHDCFCSSPLPSYPNRTSSKKPPPPLWSKFTFTTQYQMPSSPTTTESPSLYSPASSSSLAMPSPAPPICHSNPRSISLNLPSSFSPSSSSSFSSPVETPSSKYGYGSGPPKRSGSLHSVNDVRRRRLNEAPINDKSSSSFSRRRWPLSSRSRNDTPVQGQRSRSFMYNISPKTNGFVGSMFRRNRA